MKTIFFRLSKNWVWWLVVISSIVLVFGYTAYYYEQSSTYEERWNHYIEEYNTIQELKVQQEAVEKNVLLLEEMLKNTTSKERLLIEEEIRYEKESIELMTFLEENQISYSDAVEGEVLYHFERSQRGYSIEIIGIIYIFMLISSVLLVGQIVCAGKTNGAFVMSYLHNGRRKSFQNEAWIGYLILTCIYWAQIIIVFILREDIASQVEYVIYYNGGEITMLSDKTEMFLMAISVFMMISGYYVIHYILAQLISNSTVFCVIAVAITVGLIVLINVLSDVKFFCALGIILPYIYSKSISIGYYLVVQSGRIVILLISLWWIYRCFMKKNIRTRYE